ncbi:MAG: hypothetical protein HYT80_10425 [Euryarchaeota archaeon]|nr:hypothetical protein [Euryarchaeota archaeon]
MADTVSPVVLRTAGFTAFALSVLVIALVFAPSTFACTSDTASGCTFMETGWRAHEKVIQKAMAIVFGALGTLGLVAVVGSYLLAPRAETPRL